MPRVKIDYVVSFSSEDPEHPASNLLNWEVSKKKWLCKKGETTCSVVLQLARAVKISAIHIGAHHAALVEVLVARSEATSEEFQVLVPSSVFLSREESRRGAAERVRAFSGDLLQPTAACQRWDRLRILCSQPYDRHQQYGLSFVHVDEAEGGGAGAVPARLLTLDTFSSDEEEFKPGELFAKHLQKTSAAATQNTPSNTGAQIRQATSQALKNIPESSTKLVKTPINKTSVKRDRSADGRTTDRIDRSRETLLYTPDEERPNAKIDHVMQRHRDEKRREDRSKNDKHDRKDKDKTNVSSEDKSKHDRKDKTNNNSEDKSKHDRKDKTNNNSEDKSKHDRKDKGNVNSPKRKDDKNVAKRNKSDSPPRNSRPESRSNENNDGSRETQAVTGQKKDKELRKRRRSDSQEMPGPVSEEPHHLLRGAVLVLSGYENPRRAHVIRTALALGARVSRDWAPHCTHLICAFPNTPKLRAVRAVRAAPGAVVPAARAEWLEACAAQRRVLPWRWYAAEPHRQVAPPAHLPSDPARTSPRTDSEEDTDDEIEKVLQQQKKRKVDSKVDTVTATANEERRKTTTVEDSEDEATTEEESSEPPAVRPFGGALPDLLAGRTLALAPAPAAPDTGAPAAPDTGAPAPTLLTRYVRAYGGDMLPLSALEEGSEVDYIMRWHSGASACGAGGAAVVTPRWLGDCVAARALLPPP